MSQLTVDKIYSCTEEKVAKVFMSVDFNDVNIYFFYDTPIVKV